MTPTRNIPSRANSGFSLIEVLMALLILSLLSAMVAAAIPTVIRTYTNAVNASNAQVALSTTTAALRDELGMAQYVEMDASGNVGKYVDGNGHWAKIVNFTPAEGQSSLGKGLRKLVYMNKNDTTPHSTFALVPDAAITDSLSVTCGQIEYNNGAFTVKNLEVKNEGNTTLADTGGDFCVWAVGIDEAGS